MALEILDPVVPDTGVDVLGLEENRAPASRPREMRVDVVDFTSTRRRRTGYRRLRACSQVSRWRFGLT